MIKGSYSASIATNLAALYGVYSALSELLEIYYSRPFNPKTAELQHTYSTLYVATESILVKSGMESLRQDCYIPFPTLFDRDKKSVVFWETTHRRKVIEACGLIESKFYAAGSPAFDNLNEIENLIDETRKCIRKYRKEQKKAVRKTNKATQQNDSHYEFKKKKIPLWKKIAIGITICLVASGIVLIALHYFGKL